MSIHRNITPAALSGLDASRPAAAAGLVGVVYVATDSGQRYLCVSPTAWVVASALMGSDKASVGPSPANYGALYCSGSVGAGPQGWDGTSGAMVLWLQAAPTTGETIVDFRDSAGNARGWYLTIGTEAGNRYQMAHYAIKSGGYRQTLPTPLDLTGLTGQLVAFAWSITGGNIRCSLNGAAVVATALGGSGDYVQRQAGDPIVMLTNVAGTTPATSTRLAWVSTYSTVIADADLVTMSAAALTDCRAPTPSGATQSFAFAGAWWPRGLSAKIYGEAFRNGISASVVSYIPKHEY